MHLGEIDRELAAQLWKYASDPATLTTLGAFFPYQIPHGVVRSMEELAGLAMMRTSHDAELKQHFDTLADAASQWLSEIRSLVSVDGDNYTTRLDHQISDENYKRHQARTHTLGETGFDLHEKFLRYQRYYASL